MPWPSCFFFCTVSSLRLKTNPPPHGISSAPKGWTGAADTFCRSMLSKRRQNPSPVPSPAGLDLLAGGAGERTLSREHSDGDARVAELDEGAALTVNPLTGQKEVFGAHVSMDQVFIFLRSEKADSAKNGSVATLLPKPPPVSSPQVVTHSPPAPARPRQPRAPTDLCSSGTFCNIPLLYFPHQGNRDDGVGGWGWRAGLIRLL